MAERKSRARTIAAWLWGLAITTGALPAVAASTGSSDVLYPELAGTTIIDASGIVGIKMRLPKAMTLADNDMRMSVSADTNLAWVMLRWEGFDCGYDFCPSNRVEFHRFPSSSNVPRYVQCVDPLSGDSIACYYPAGVVEIYVVSDGTVRFTSRWSELQGVTQVRATGQVEGVVEQVPVRECDPFLGCAKRYGYSVHEAGTGGRPGMAFVSRWQGGNGPFNTTVRVAGGDACLYPSSGFEEKSPSPDAHPEGCELSDDGSVPPYGVEFGAGFGNDTHWNLNAHGPVYAGFRDLRYEVIGEERADVRAFWLTSGIACASGNYVDCDDPAPK